MFYFFRFLTKRMSVLDTLLNDFFNSYYYARES